MCETDREIHIHTQMQAIPGAWCPTWFALDFINRKTSTQVSVSLAQRAGGDDDADEDPRPYRALKNEEQTKLLDGEQTVQRAVNRNRSLHQDTLTPGTYSAPGTGLSRLSHRPPVRSGYRCQNELRVSIELYPHNEYTLNLSA